MSESSAHIALVNHLVHWVDSNTDWSKKAALLVSIPGAPAASQPPGVGSFIPDVFLKSEQAGFALIGEAKTVRDLEREHSRSQFVAYLQYLSTYPSSLLLVAVPWTCAAQARSLLQLLQRRHGLSGVLVKVIDQL